MRVAVIGGGAAGLATGYLLDAAHHVTLFERREILGGNIRTLNRNVPCAALPAGIHLDAGVIEFDRRHFPAFHALMADLDVELATVPGASGLFLADGRAFYSPARLTTAVSGAAARLRALARLAPLGLARRRFMRRTARLSPSELNAATLAGVLGDDVFSLWARLLVMYAYSLPAEQAAAVPAALAVPTLRAHLYTDSWSRVVGGVYVYVERLLERFGGEVRLAARIAAVRRRSDGVELELAGGERLEFDAVVFAATPEQALELLADASDAERRRFGAWRAQTARVLVHTDRVLHRRHGIRAPSEFDLFETAPGGFGYSAYLNRLVGLDEARPEATPAYQLAFGLDAEIDPARVLHAQSHTTPRYTVAALRHRDEVIATNGERRTYHAGAWLGDGLHEGAVRSAMAVSRLLGGRRLAH